MSDMRRMMMMFTRPVDSEPQPVLPYDAQVEYLQSSGTQYINLPLTASAGDFFAVGGVITPIYSNTNRYTIFGANPHVQFYSNFYSRNSSSGYITYSSAIGSNSTGGGWGGVANEEMSFEMSTTGMTKNGTFTALARPLKAAITGFRLFGGYLNTYRYPFRVKSFYVKRGNDTLYDLVAVRKDGVGYLYDKISGELFGNSGTGSFTYGDDVTT